MVKRSHASATITQPTEPTVLKKQRWENDAVVAIIYRYRDITRGAVCYVGQTKRDVAVRHQEHLSNEAAHPGSFDFALRANPENFILRIEETKTFMRVTHTAAQTEAQEWMNAREIHYISKYDTYHNGFNMTKGGQLGRDQAYFEALAKKQANLWKCRMLALRTYSEEKGDLLVPISFAFPSDHPKKELRFYTLGNTVNHLRQGNIKTTIEQKNDLTKMGFVWDVFADQWKCRMLALRTYSEEKGDLLVPSRFAFPSDHPKPELRGYPIGQTVNDLRTGSIKTTIEQKNDLTKMGFVWGVFADQWKCRMLALRTYSEEKGDLLVPKRFAFPSHHPKPELRGYPIGQTVFCLRVGHITTTEDQKNDLTKMGFVWGGVRAYHRETMMIAFRRWAHDSARLTQSSRFPMDYHVVRLRGYHLGNRLRTIRCGQLQLSSDEQAELDELGYCVSFPM